MRTLSIISASIIIGMNITDTIDQVMVFKNGWAMILPRILIILLCVGIIIRDIRLAELEKQSA
jgi:hypothetical protein